MKEAAITFLSNGAGQDTTYLIHRFCTDPEFKAKHVKGELIVVGSDTGDEHDHTYENVVYLRKICREAGIKFYWLTPEMGFHSNAWQSLFGQFYRNNNIGSAAFSQTCTDNLKIQVVNRFTEWYLCKYYGYEMGGKKAFYRFYEDHGSIRLILGFAAKEESRTSKGNEADPVWKKLTVERYYPLILDDVDRQGAIDHNEANIEHTVWPSNCMRCFYMTDPEVVWLNRFYPDKFLEWVARENAKLTKYDHKEVNLGVFGKLTLEQKLEKALLKYGHWTDGQLNEYKYSHGHCIKSKY